jgi:hypothetical protein
LPPLIHIVFAPLQALEAKLEEFDIEELLELLVSNGYASLQQVAELGEADMAEIGVKKGLRSTLRRLIASLPLPLGNVQFSIAISAVTCNTWSYCDNSAF